jgi:hypothetical protein
MKNSPNATVYNMMSGVQLDDVSSCADALQAVINFAYEKMETPYDFLAAKPEFKKLLKSFVENFPTDPGFVLHSDKPKQSLAAAIINNNGDPLIEFSRCENNEKLFCEKISNLKNS